MSDDDATVALLDALQRANPVSVDSVSDRRDLPSAHALFAEITARPPRRIRRRTMIVVIALLVLAIASVLGAFAFVDRASEPNPSVRPLCFERADRDSLAIVGVGSDLDQACAALWGAEGGFAGPAPAAFDRCLLDTGAVGVFPGESGSVCDDLGLPSVRSSSFAERLRAAGIDGGETLLQQCKDRAPGTVVAYADASAIVEGVLAKHDITGWTIEPGDHLLRPAEPCASLYFDDATETAVIQALDWGIEGGGSQP
jgi:hypothetical protein